MRENKTSVVPDMKPGYDESVCSLCDQNAECVVYGGKTICACKSGFSGNGYECSRKHIIDTEDTPSSGTDDEQACAKCDKHASCIVQGQMTKHVICVCKAGYFGNGTYCEDLTSCSKCHRNAVCIADGGRVTCRCFSGFKGDGISCHDIDECQEPGRCHENAICVNTVGSYKCRCPVGYKGDGHKTCQLIAKSTRNSDFDECISGRNPCHRHAKCTNTFGGFTCECLSGYRGDGIKRCDSVTGESTTTARLTTKTAPITSSSTEAKGLKSVCDLCHENAECVYSHGRNTCHCLPGYFGNGIVCEDMDECKVKESLCHKLAICINTPGSYICRCPQDHYGDGKTTCMPNVSTVITEAAVLRSTTMSISDAKLQTSPCQLCHDHAKCTTNRNQTICNCLPGFVGDGTTCLGNLKAFHNISLSI
ncbi:unnamed protein product [Soboliphyme baturini]|uniref:EGF-like domain-containing protein n=1 Tax=Soboliphyme baturini TaxID=241478 RepID=A0A183J167_9BILA|nr:unnamed protein product [Soboliphyme baturini]